MGHRSVIPSIGIVTLLIFGAICPLFSVMNFHHPINEPAVIPVVSSYVTHSPFNITRDSDFNDQGWPGIGTFGDPYRIEGLNITTTDSCIWIMNTSSYFSISDCLLNSSFDSTVIGLINISHGVVENNVILGGFIGVDGTNVTDSSISRNEFGSSIWSSINAIDVNNTVIEGNLQNEGTPVGGVAIGTSFNCTIRDNIFTNISGYGIGVYGAQECKILNNSIHSYIDEGYFVGAIGIHLSGAIDCYVSDNNVSSFFLANIEVSGRNCTINNNTVSNASDGLRLRGENVRVFDNTMHNNYQGLTIILSNNCIINENRLYENYGSGMYVLGGNGSQIMNNEIVGNGAVGIYLASTSYARIEGNQISGYDQGLIFGEYSSWGSVEGAPPLHTFVINNVFEDSGIGFGLESLVGYDQTIIGNTIDGKPIGFHYGISNEIIDADSWGQVVLVDSFNVTVKDGQFYNISGPIILYYSSDCNVTDNIIQGAQIGIQLQDSPRSSVQNNSISDCWFDSDFFYGNYIGILVRTSSESRVDSNVVYHNDVGIRIEESDEILITANDIDRNMRGLVLSDVSDSILRENLIHHNEDGLELGTSSFNFVTHNLIFNNTGIGISVDGLSASNQIYSNQIGWNGQNAECRSASNIWDDGDGIGNAWSDYDGEGPYELEFGRDNHPTLLTHLTFPNETISEGWIIDPVLLISIIGVIGVTIIIIVFFAKEFRKS